ncbi:MAG TPA: hypothetical protein H9875_07840 [Candidatus Levilactobacillus faecigallinarum]|uniref:Uncharacterized protein n=1 Tax=Candidatus Levilactobacillus faecigallinarum TaxID=2838638 RepID=A0A9D1QUT6_9LACO|nr:hypothetical protein [Candidatus Levilactobacillus faecigallinarum]
MATRKTPNVDQLTTLATTTHHPVVLHATTDVVLMDKQDFETAQRIIQLATGSSVPFMTLLNQHSV